MDKPTYPAPEGFDAVPSKSSSEQLRQQRKLVIGIAVGVIVVLGLVITGLVLLLIPSTPQAYVSRIRDVFIIIMAFESLLIGVVLIILIFQLAQLTNLLKNEIKPILDSTNETVSTLRGTTSFISNNLAEPVIKINEFMAALQKFLEVFGIGRRKI